jgi:hypothetical protein
VSDTEAAHKVSHALRSKARRQYLPDTKDDYSSSLEAEKDSSATGIGALQRHHQEGRGGGRSGSGGGLGSTLPSGMSLPQMSPSTSTLPNALQQSLQRQRRHPMPTMHSITTPSLDLRRQMETAAMLANRQGFALQQRLVPTAMTTQNLFSGSSLPMSWPSGGDRMPLSMQPGGTPQLSHMLQMRHLQESALAQADMLQQAFTLPLQHPEAGGRPLASSMIATTMPPYLPGPATTTTTTGTTTRLPFTTMGGHPNHPLNWFNNGIAVPSQDSLGMAQRRWEFSQFQQQHLSAAAAAAAAAASSTNVRAQPSLNELGSTSTTNTAAQIRPPGSLVPDNIASGSRPR